VREEVLLHDLALVPEAQDEVVDSPFGVVAHDVPEDRPASDRDHRLGRPLRRLAHADTEPAPEDDDFHASAARAVTGELVGCTLGTGATLAAASTGAGDPGSITCATGTGTISFAPHSAVEASCAEISGARFHGRITIASGRVSAIR